jgi:hypothetical protein
MYLLLQDDQNNAQKYDQSDVHCQRSYYDVTIVGRSWWPRVEVVGMRLPAGWDCGFESRRGHGCLFGVLRVSGFSQLLNVHGVNDARQTEIRTAEPLVPEPSAFEVEMAIEKIKRHKSPDINQVSRTD